MMKTFAPRQASPSSSITLPLSLLGFSIVIFVLLVDVVAAVRCPSGMTYVKEYSLRSGTRVSPTLQDTPQIHVVMWNNSATDCKLIIDLYNGWSSSSKFQTLTVTTGHKLAKPKYFWISSFRVTAPSTSVKYVIKEAKNAVLRSGQLCSYRVTAAPRPPPPPPPPPTPAPPPPPTPTLRLTMSNALSTSVSASTVATGSPTKPPTLSPTPTLSQTVSQSLSETRTEPPPHSQSDTLSAADTSWTVSVTETVPTATLSATQMVDDNDGEDEGGATIIDPAVVVVPFSTTTSVGVVATGLAADPMATTEQQSLILLGLASCAAKAASDVAHDTMFALVPVRFGPASVELVVGLATMLAAAVVLHFLLFVVFCFRVNSELKKERPLERQVDGASVSMVDDGDPDVAYSFLCPPRPAANSKGCLWPFSKNVSRRAMSRSRFPAWTLIFLFMWLQGMTYSAVKQFAEPTHESSSERILGYSLAVVLIALCVFLIVSPFIFVLRDFKATFRRFSPETLDEGTKNSSVLKALVPTGYWRRLPHVTPRKPLFAFSKPHPVNWFCFVPSVHAVLIALVAAIPVPEHICWLQTVLFAVISGLYTLIVLVKRPFRFPAVNVFVVLNGMFIVTIAVCGLFPSKQVVQDVVLFALTVGSVVSVIGSVLKFALGRVENRQLIKLEEALIDDGDDEQATHAKASYTFEEADVEMSLHASSRDGNNAATKGAEATANTHDGCTDTEAPPNPKRRKSNQRHASRGDEEKRGRGRGGVTKQQKTGSRYRPKPHQSTNPLLELPEVASDSSLTQYDEGVDDDGLATSLLRARR